MMIRTSTAPSEVTPARYLLPSAMSLSRRAATRGSTTPSRIPLPTAMRGLPPGRGPAGEVLVAIGDELEQAGRAPRLDDADPHPVAEGDEAIAFRIQLDRV